MGCIRRMMTNIINGGLGAVFSWLLSKWLGGVAIGILLAMYFPGRFWLWIGWIALVLAFIVGIPAMRAAWCCCCEAPEQGTETDE